MINRRKFLVGSGTAAALAVGTTYVSVRSMGTTADYDAYSARLRAALPEQASMLDLLRYATLAANGHNTQPWRFQFLGQRVAILPDWSKRTPVVDPDDHHLFVSLGCAAENLAIAAAARGKPGEIRFEAANNTAVIFDYAEGPRAVTPLFEAIPRRQSTRAVYDGRPVSRADLHSLSTAATLVGVDTVLIADRPTINKVRDLVIAGNAAQMTDGAFVGELKDWVRFNPRDGLFSASSGNPTLPGWLAPFMFDMAFQTRTENDKYARHIDSSAGVAVFFAAHANPEHWVLVGRACQRFALQATAIGVKTAFINQPAEVPQLRPEMAALAGLPGRRPSIIMRFGYGPELPFSPRRVPQVVV
jgi:nitroreductase